MPIPTKLTEFMESKRVPFEHHAHATVYTTQQMAESMHVPNREMAKSVVLKADGRLILAVLPADQKVDLDHLQFIIRASNIRLATEEEFKDEFPSCELGAMPPFGNLFGIATYCDTLLEQNDHIELNAGLKRAQLKGRSMSCERIK